MSKQKNQNEKNKNKLETTKTLTPTTSKTETTKQVTYPVITMNDKGTIIIPQEILAQITFLHASAGKTEWSGLLFYDVISGDPSNPKDFVLQVKHIYLMDIGSAAYTEYETDGDLVDVYTEFDDAMDWKMGHIHTHHTMATFFSGTDMSELNDNVDKHNYYLSLIVNMDGVYSAKVAFLSDTELKQTINFKNDKGILQGFSKKKTETTMVTIDMQIKYGGITSFFSDRVTQVREKIKAAALAKKDKWKGNGYGRGNFKGQSAFWTDDLPEVGEERNKGFVTGFGKTTQVPTKYTSSSTTYPNPLKLSNLEIERLTKNIIAVNPDLKETKSVYSCLYTVLENSTGIETSVYFNYLTDNLDQILENFFGEDLEVDELKPVMEEVIQAINRYSGNVKLSKFCLDLVDTIGIYINESQALEDAEADELLTEHLRTQ